MNIEALESFVLLADEILDVGIVYHKPKLLKFDVTPFLEDEIILTASNKSTLNINKEILSKDLLGLPLLYADLGEAFFQWLSEQLGDSPLLRLSVDHISCIVEYVKDGYGYGFVPKSIVLKELSEKELTEIRIKDATPPSKKVYMLINKSKKDSLAVRHWLKITEGFN